MKHMSKLCVCSCCFCQLGERMRNFIKHIHVFQILSFHTHTVKLSRSLEWLCEEFFPNVICFISERYRPRTQDFRLSSRNSLLCTFFSSFFWPQGMWDPSSPTRDRALYSIKILSIHQNLDLELNLGNSLAVQWLGLGTFTAKVPGSIPGQGTKIPQAKSLGQKRKKKKEISLLWSNRLWILFFLWLHHTKWAVVPCY